MSAGNKRYLLLMAIAVVSASVLMPPICNLLFQCGCSWPWTTAAAHCNIHHPLPPHCPWCSHGNLGYYLPYSGFIVGQLGCGLVALQLTRRLIPAAIVTLIAILPVGLFMGAITVALVDYPHFILR
jgi:hypothetical protein